MFWSHSGDSELAKHRNKIFYEDEIKTISE